MDVAGVLARNIKRRARQKGLAIYALADACGVSRSMLYDIIRGRHAPTTTILDRIARGLDCEAWELLRPISDGPDR